MLKLSVFHQLSLLGLGFTIFSPSLALATSSQEVAVFMAPHGRETFQYSLQNGVLHCETIAPSTGTQDVCQKVPVLTPMKEVAIGDLGRVACALIESGQVVCWSKVYEIKTPQVSNLKNPNRLMVSRYHACILDDDGLKCWRPREADPVVTYPDFKGATNLSNAGYVFYGLKQGKIIAVNANVKQMLPSPLDMWDDITLTHLSVSEEASDYYHNEGFIFCGIESERALCTREQSGDFASGIRSDLGAPITAIAAGPVISCAQTPRGVKCWNSNSGAPIPRLDRPELKNVRRIWTLESYRGIACVETNESKIKCWEEYRDLEIN
jgi:hypothetical protein